MGNTPENGPDPGAAGGDAVRAIVRALAFGRDLAGVRETIEIVRLDDLVLVEHFIILKALKALSASEGTLAIDALKAVMAPDDPACFALLVLDGWVRGQPEGAGASELQRSRALLVQARTAQEQASRRSKVQAVQLAHDILSGAASAVDAARTLARVTEELPAEERRCFEVFSTLADAVDQRITGEVRRYWAPSVLAQHDRWYAELEASSRPELERACRALIDRWSAV